MLEALYIIYAGSLKGHPRGGKPKSPRASKIVYRLDWTVRQKDFLEAIRGADEPELSGSK
jgi:hypothetical protein